MTISRPSITLRVLTTLAVLAVVVLGRQIPLPTPDADPLGAAHSAPRSISILSLGVTPIFSALFLVELARLVFPFGSGAGSAGHAPLSRPLLALAFAFAAFQGFGVGRWIEAGPGAIDEPSLVFELTTMATLIGATAFLAWGCRLISRFGLGDGFWLLLATFWLANVASDAVRFLASQGREAMSEHAILAVAGFPALAALAIIVARLVEARAVLGPGAPGASFLRVDHGFVWPPILATAIASWAPVAVMLAGRLGAGSPGPSTTAAIRELCVVVLIFLITAMRGGRLSDHGAKSSATPRSSAIYLMAAVEAAICLASDWLAASGRAPIRIGGPMLIVTVAVAMDIFGQMRSEAARAPA